MGYMIDLLAPALQYVIKRDNQHSDISRIYVMLIDCVFYNICRKEVKKYLEHDIVKIAKRAAELKDLKLAASVYSWYLMCTKKRIVRDYELEDTGEVVYIDVTESHMKLYPPPDVPCGKV
ncbi:MAG: hypothetical protein QW607_11175 [Desulfurococcaceae archaeon]